MQKGKVQTTKMIQKATFILTFEMDWSFCEKGNKIHFSQMFLLFLKASLHVWQEECDLASNEALSTTRWQYQSNV